MLPKSGDMLNKNTWGVKKGRGQEEPATKSSAIYLLLTFTSKAHNNIQGVFPTMIGFVTLGHLLFIADQAKRWPRVTKPIMVGKTPCILLCTFEVKVSNK